MKFWKHLNKYISNSNQYPQLDSTTPWYNFNNYVECCKSLDRPVSVGGFMRYQNYLKEIGIL